MQLEVELLSAIVVLFVGVNSILPFLQSATGDSRGIFIL